MNGWELGGRPNLLPRNDDGNSSIVVRVVVVMDETVSG